jgi:hypothetical protein
MIGLSLFAGLSLGLVSIPAAAQANLVQNGSFETGYEATTQINSGWPSNHGLWAPIGYNGATDTIPNWTVSGGGVDWSDSNSSVPNSMIAADGARFVDLNSCCSNPPGMISQTIATTPGVSYTLSFSYSGHPYSPCYFGPKPMQANAGSASLVVTADPLAEGYLDGTNIWHAASVSFTATSSSTVISFQSLENDGTCAGPLVDNVRVTADNLVQNGSFETGYEATTQINSGWPSNHGLWAPIGYNGATDTIPNWTVSGGGVDWQDSDSSVPNSMAAADGARFVDLNSCCSNPPGMISQTIATTPGVSYTLSFSYSGHPYSPCYFGPKPMQANAGSASLVVTADPLAEGYLDGTDIWHAASVSFTATSSSTVISFQSLENDGTCAGPLVDNVRVTANNLVQNGSFEMGFEATTQVNSGWPSNHGLWAPIGYNGATDTIPNWTVSGGGVDWHDTNSTIPNSMAAADGARMVDLNSCCSNPPGMISQTIATTPGVSYTLSFSYSGHPYSPCYFGPKPMQANAGSASLVVTADPLAEGYLDSTNLWHAASVNFTATSSSTVISFQSLENDGTCAGPLVDNVWVLPQPPPEPVACPCSSIDQFNFILGNLNYCLAIGEALITSIDPPISYAPYATNFRLAAGGSDSQCGVLKFGVAGTVLTVAPDQAAACLGLVRAAATSRGVACFYF